MQRTFTFRRPRPGRQLCGSAALVAVLALAGSEAAGAQDAAALPPPLRPQTFEFGISAGATHSDNILLVPQNETSGTIGELGVNLLYNRKSRRLQSDVEVDASYEHFFDDEFDDDVIGGADATLMFGIIPERLEWFLQDNFGQSRVDALAADTPANRENTNYLTTGPDLTLRLGGRNALRLAGRYSRTDYETAPLDGDRFGGTLSLIRQLSEASALSLNAMTESLEYDDQTTANDGYDRNEAYLRYELTSTRTDLGLDAGITQIDNGGDKSDGTLLRALLRRQISASSSIYVNLSNEFTDAGNVFRSTQDLNGVSTQAEAVLATADALERRLAYVGWAFHHNRTSFGLNGEYSEEQYENDVSLDRSLARYGAYFARQLTPEIQLRFDVHLSNEDFDNVDLSIDEWQGIAALDWQLGRTLSWRLQLEHRDRDGSVASVQEYTENRASVFVTWSPRRTR